MLHIIHIFGKTMLTVSMLFIIIFLYGVTFNGEKNTNIGEGNQVAFILDVSQSMRVSDLGGQSRLSAAKQKILQIISENRGQSFALSIFAGESQRVLPFTQDTSLFTTFLHGIDSRNITLQGTNIDLALQDALENFKENKVGDIIILTDGDEDDINVSSEVITTLKKGETQISIVGVGSLEGGLIPTGDVFSPYKLYQGRPVKVSLNKKELEKVSRELEGKYYDLDEKIILGDSAVETDDYSILSIWLILAMLSWILYISTIGYTLYYAKK